MRQIVVTDKKLRGIPRRLRALAGSKSCSHVVRAITVVVIAATFGGSPSAAESCGKLCEFERAATKPDTAQGKAKPPTRGERAGSDEDDGLGALLIRPFAEVILLGIVEGGANSSLRANGGSAGVRARQDGEALIPRLRVDLSTQRVDRATDGWDVRIEAGHGALGLQGRMTRYREEVGASPGAVSRLDIRQAHVLYRMAGETFEVDLGLGVLQMSGQATHSAFSFTLPVLIHPLPWLGVEYRPAWATIADNTIRDQEIALVLGGPYASLRLGYRRIDSDGGTGGAVLQGPFAGLSVRF